MANFPSVLNTFNRPTTTDRLNSPSHSALHNTVSSALGQVEAVIGVDGINSVVGTMMYDLRSPASGGGGHVQTAIKGGTGQTTYTKGDILAASSSSVLTKVAVGGTDGYALIVDSTQPTGVTWGVPNNVPTVRVYGPSTATVWNKPSTLSYVVIEMQAPGGAGAGTQNSGGGGAGAYVRKVIAASSMPTVASVLVPAAGTGSILTYFGSILQNTGGTTATAEIGGVSGSVLIAGNINFNGQAGMSVNTGSPHQGGAGGYSFLGGGGMGGAWTGNTTQSSAGQGGILGGGGGGGTPATDGSPLGAGGAGGDGTVIVYEY